MGSHVFTRRYSTIRTLIFLDLQLGMTTDHLGVSTAFHNGVLKEEVYLRQPEEYLEDKDRLCFGYRQTCPMTWLTNASCFATTSGVTMWLLCLQSQTELR